MVREAVWTIRTTPSRVQWQSGPVSGAASDACRPMFPLGTVLFPHAVIPLHVFEPRYRALVHDCMAGDARFGIVLIERGSEVGGGDQRSGVGTLARMVRASEIPDGRWLVLARGERRVRVCTWLTDDPYPRAEVEDWPDEGALPDRALLEQAEQVVRRTRALLSESGAASAALPAEWGLDGDADVAAWELCAAAPLNTYDAQRLLTCAAARPRIELLTQLTGAMEGDLRRLLGA